MEDHENRSADVHSDAKTAFDSLLVPNGFKRTADWINADRAGHSGREYSRDAVRVRLDWDERGSWIDVRLRTVNRNVYPELPDETQLLWYKDL